MTGVIGKRALDMSPAVTRRMPLSTNANFGMGAALGLTPLTWCWNHSCTTQVDRILYKTDKDISKGVQKFLH